MTKSPSVADGVRLYAIGDVHGRLDLLSELIALIREDAATTFGRTIMLLMIGDMVDRGPDSAGVLDTVQKFDRQSRNFIVLKGNHEDMMVAALRGDREAMSAWVRFGGDATLASWGVTAQVIEVGGEILYAAARAAVPPKTLSWLRGLPTHYRSGDYFFAHAGIRPGVPLAKQRPEDLMWIGQEFAASEDAHPAVIVHGHMIEEDGPIFRSNRVGIDTGAYRTGRLSAVAFDQDRRWVLSTGGGSAVNRAAQG